MRPNQTLPQRLTYCAHTIRHHLHAVTTRGFAGVSLALLLVMLYTAAPSIAQCGFELTEQLGGRGAVTSGAQFGRALAATATLAVVGAPTAASDNGMGSPGTAYVFRPGNNSWIESAALVPADGSPGDAFGSAVATDGTRALVGAPYTDGEFADTGAAYLFSNPGDGWIQKAKLVSATPVGEDLYGHAVALRDDLAVVGAPGYDGGRGLVEIYRFVSDAWQLEATLVPEIAEYGSHCGQALDLFADVLVVGAPGALDGTGAVLVYQCVGAEWQLEQVLVSPEPATAVDFGAAVALHGDVLVIGEPGNHAITTRGGAAHLYRHGGDTWSHELSLPAPEPNPNGRFGAAVDVGVNLALIGEPGDNALGKDAGAIHLFRFDGSTWAREQKLVAQSSTYREFGSALACAEATALVGAPFQVSKSALAPAAGGAAFAGAIPPDCNLNGQSDDCDIAGGTSEDADADGVPDECMLPPPLPFEARVSLSEKGSVLILPHIEVRWDASLKLIRDTFIALHNDSPEDVQITMFYVLEQCVSGDLHFQLTEQQPAYWSVETGSPGPDGGSLGPITAFDMPVCDDPPACSELVLQGYAVIIAVDGEGNQIRWNRLAAQATIVDYRDGTACQYGAYAFAAHGVEHGEVVGTPGEIVFSQQAQAGFASAPRLLLFEFFRPASTPFLGSVPPYLTGSVVEDTRLTLMMLDIDLRTIPDGPWNTFVWYEIWDENEVGHTGLDECLPKWRTQKLTELGGAFASLPTDRGYARIWSGYNPACEVLVERPPGSGIWVTAVEPIDTGLLGVAMEYTSFSGPGGPAYDTNAGALRGVGVMDEDKIPVLRYTTLGSSGGGSDFQSGGETYGSQRDEGVRR